MLLISFPGNCYNQASLRIAVLINKFIIPFLTPSRTKSLPPFGECCEGVYYLIYSIYYLY